MNRRQNTAGERTARMVLAAISEPASSTVGAMLTTVGAEETLRLLADPESVLPGSLDTAAVRLVQRRLSPKLRDDLADQVTAQTEALELRVLVPGEAGWPVSLTDLGDAAPYALWVKGDPELLTSSLASRVTMTGARAASAYGVHVATELSAELASEPRILISGGAYGVDGAVHRAALATRRGSTIAVLAGGVDRYYPAGHHELLGRIAENGLVLSEMPPGAAPTRHRFLSRNRLLAALGGATVIVEAGVRSGSLNTAFLASDLGRPVGAVPGPVTSAASAGCHRLLREDFATIVTSAQDVTTLLDPPTKSWALGQKYQDLAREIEHDTPGSSRAM